MNNVLAQFKQAGGSITIRVIETGGLLSLTFKPGERRKKLAIAMNGVDLIADLVLEEIPDAVPGSHNLALVIDFPKNTSTRVAKEVEVNEQLTVAAVPVEPVTDEVVPPPTEPSPEASPENTLPVEEPITTTTPATHQGKRKNRR